MQQNPQIDLESFPENVNAVVIGASGGIGAGFVDLLVGCEKVSKVYAFSNQGVVLKHEKVTAGCLDLTDENSIERAANSIDAKCHIVIVATGVLHGEGFSPEKTIRELSPESISKIFQINFVGPSLVGKYFLKHIPRDEKSVFAFLSARVGSISDNQLGGWYSYRASKAALNMFIKTLSIEAARKYKYLTMMGLHPGTVETDLSAPFRSNVPTTKLFTPAFSASSMLKVIDKVDVSQTGRLFAYNGQEIEP